MKIKMIALALLIAVKASGQTKQVSQHVSGGTETYYVLTADNNIREGEYKLYSGGPNPLPVVEGYYRNNLKDSLWRFYSRGVLTHEGNYKAGEKIGVWTGYTRGFERLKYDFTAQKLLLYTPAMLDTVQNFQAISGPATILDRQPIYIQGIANFARTIQREIRYPAIAREGNKEGEVVVSFIIDDKGHADNYKVETKLGYGMDEEVLRVVSQLDTEWVPGSVDGKPVAVKCEVPVLFAIFSGKQIVVKPNEIVILVSRAAH